MLIAIESIREAGDVRHIAADKAADAGLTASIQAQGVLTPILVTPDGDSGGYTVIAGRRRLRCARLAGFAEIPAEVMQLTNGWATAAALAENMVRARLHPLDQWRGVKSLLEQGFTVQQAAAAIGLDERMTRRMERLGSLHPAIQTLIETYDDIPEDWYLRVIANAPPELQAKAAKAKGMIEECGGSKNVRWHAIAQACTVTRYSRATALFEPQLMEWDQDWLAQPGADDEFTTTERDRFLELQKQALDDEAFELAGKKRRMEIVAYGGNGLEIPKGFEVTSYQTHTRPDKLKTTDVLFAGIGPDGSARYSVAIDKQAAKAAEKKKAAKAAERSKQEIPDGAEADDAGEDVEEAETTPIAKADKPGITKDGMEIVYAAKTEALQATLREGISATSPETLLSLMILAFGADNVTVHGMGRFSDWDQSKFRDLAARLLIPGGVLSDISMADVRGLVGECLARILTVRAGGGWQSSSSGQAAEWIGAAIGADHALPRFDTEAFLATVTGDELRAAAASASIKATGSVKDLRSRLVGNMPDWRPSAAAFGAPAPVVEGDRHDD